MKRWICRIMVCLLLGVVTTVGVAWACTHWRPGSLTYETEYFRRDSLGRYWHIWMLGGGLGWSEVVIDGQGTPTSLPQDAHTDHLVLPTWFESGAYFRAGNRGGYAEVAGLPYRCLIGSWRYDDYETGGVQEVQKTVSGPPPRQESGFFHIGDDEQSTAVLPLRPILPGFLINTLFYGVIWFTLILGWRAHRRVIRRWQGYCPLCTYDLRGDVSTGCPECGWGRE